MSVRLILFAGILLLAGSSASAQSRDPFAVDFSANYDVIYHEPGVTSNVGAHFDIASTITRDVPYLVLVGEIGANHFDAGTVSSFLGGARLRFPNASQSVLPFAQLLLGLYHCGVCGINDFALQGGAGLDFKTGRAVRIRTQLDVRHVFDTSSFNSVRVSAGVVLPLNR
jgi:hypothetical protein